MLINRHFRCCIPYSNARAQVVRTVKCVGVAVAMPYIFVVNKSRKW